jgi:hypothetical protein
LGDHGNFDFYSSIMKLFHSRLLLAGLFGSVALFNTTSANAAITGCAGGNSGQALWSDILGTPGFTCTIEDKIYSNFTYSSVINLPGQPTSGIDGFDQFAFSTIGALGLTHNLNVQSANSYLNTVITLSYTVTRAVPPNIFKSFSGNITGDNGTSWALSIAATSAGTSSTPGYPTLGQSATTPTVNYNPNTISSTFTNTLIANQNGLGVTQFSNRLNQAVPGPLPLLGAGAALGFSRKLRARTKLAV